MTTPLRDQALIDQLEAKGALLTGHFRLSSGRHSDRFVQKFRVLEDPPLVEGVAAALAESARAWNVDVVVSAAVGGIILGYECARQLGTLGIFVEKEDGVPRLRRGFMLAPGDRALVVEDVVTTGGSVREVMHIVRASGAEVAGVGTIVQRAPVDFGVHSVALVDIPIESFEAADCPQCKRGEPLNEPGSRYLR